MRKVILFNMISLDGFFAGPNGDIDWHTVDEEFNEFAIRQLESAGGLIFGRVTYQLMADYWPTPAAITDDPQVAALMNALPKYVFSRTLPAAGWKNAHLLPGPAEDSLSELKQQTGGDLFVFGSADLAATLIRGGLIDEFRLMVAPLTLGSGRPLFAGEPLRLQLLDTRRFSNGNVLLTYQPRTQ